LVPPALLAAVTQRASAYVFETYFGSPLHWVDQNTATPDVIDIYYDFRNIGNYTNNATPEQKSIYQQALADWSAVTNGKLNFVLNTTNNTGSILNLSVGDLKAVTTNPDISSAPGLTLGLTNTNFAGDGTISFASVQLDYRETWDNTPFNGNPLPGPSSPDFYSVALHEIGHALGLGHADAPFANTMTSSYRGEKLGPGADDILGISTLYKTTPNYTAITRNLNSFNVAYPPGNFNYFTGTPSVVSYWTDSGITNIANTTQIQDAGEFHQAGGVWTTGALIIGGSISPGLFDLSGGSFTTTSATVNVGTLSLSGGLLQASSLAFSNGTTFNWTGGTLSLAPGATPPTLSGIANLTVPAAGVLKTAGSHMLDSLTVNGKAQLLQNGASTTVTRVKTLTIAGTPSTWIGQLDITTNTLILDTAGNKAALLAILRNQVNSGKNGGTWTGNGITSSTLPSTPGYGLAILDNADLRFTSFHGATGLTDNALFLTILHLGDANADNKVDAIDLNLLASHWLATGAAWSGGDFNTDGIVDAFDLNILAANWQYGTTPAPSLEPALAFSAFTATTPIPEPATLALLALATPALLRPRRRSDTPRPHRVPGPGWGLQASAAVPSTPSAFLGRIAVPPGNTI
jgi:hypothetical protein